MTSTSVRTFAKAKEVNEQTLKDRIKAVKYQELPRRIRIVGMTIFFSLLFVFCIIVLMPK